MAKFGVVTFYTHCIGQLVDTAGEQESFLGQSGATSASVGNGRIPEDNKEENGIAGY